MSRLSSRPCGLNRQIGLGLVLCVVVASWNCATARAVPPAISNIAPNNGTVAGGTFITIDGSGFAAGSNVTFDGVPATHVTVASAQSILARSPPGRSDDSDELANVTVSGPSGSSTDTPRDQFAYDPPPESPWLGLNGNTTKYLGPVDLFALKGVAYDRSFELTAGQTPSELERGIETEEFEKRLREDHEHAMIPVSVIEYRGYGRDGYVYNSDPEFPQERSAKESIEGRNTIDTYVEGFVKSASAILQLVNRRYPGMKVLFEPMNEPWGYTTPQFNGAEYADVIARLLPAASIAKIPLSDIYVAAYGADMNAHGQWTSGWVPAMYEAQPSLQTEIQGWYFHPYGPPQGSESRNSEGIQSLPQVQAQMTSGQNNIIVSEVGYCALDVNNGASCPGGSTHSGDSAHVARSLTEMLENALPYHEAGWLRALIVYSRNAGGWAMQEHPSTNLTAQGRALETFAHLHAWTGLVQEAPSPSLLWNWYPRLWLLGEVPLA